MRQGVAPLAIIFPHHVGIAMAVLVAALAAAIIGLLLP